MPVNVNLNLHNLTVIGYLKWFVFKHIFQHLEMIYLPKYLAQEKLEIFQ